MATDVLLDVALDRPRFAEDSGRLLDRLEARLASGFFAWHSAANFYHLVRPKRGAGGARQFLLDLLEFMEVAPATTESLKRAGQLRISDFEDAMQVAAGLACGADVVATRNLRDDRGAPLEAVTPADLLHRLP